MIRSEGEGEDGRPCIKWRKQRMTNPTGREKETIEEGEEKEIGREEEAEAQEYRDTKNRRFDKGLSEER